MRVFEEKSQSLLQKYNHRTLLPESSLAAVYVVEDGDVYTRWLWHAGYA